MHLLESICIDIYICPFKAGDPTMKSERLASSRHPVKEVVVVGLDDTKVKGKLMLGDIVWVPIRSLWWPAQVADEKMVSKSSKPSRKLANDVLLRLYGTYKYLYRDPTKYYSEFEKILKQNNGSSSETFQKMVEQDLSHMKPTRLKRGVSETEVENVNAESPNEMKKQNGIKKNRNVGSPKSATPKKEGVIKKLKKTKPDSVKHPSEKNSAFSPRRFRVMQSLGLAAPSGSPFRKNGVVVSDI